MKMSENGYTLTHNTLLIHSGYVLPYLNIPYVSLDYTKEGAIIVFDIPHDDTIDDLVKSIVRGPYINGPIHIQSGIAAIQSRGKRGMMIEYCF